MAGASTTDDPDLQRALGAEPFGTFEVAPGLDGPLGHVSVDLDRPVAVHVLEGRFGPAHRGPSAPALTARRLLQFNDTLPEEGSVGGTVLAEIDDTGEVVRVIVRRDAF